MSPTYSKAKISAFFGSHHDNLLRESIRRDVLIERYDDLQKEMSHLEDLLDISEVDLNKDLFAINEILFEMLESLVPELVEEDHDCEKVHPAKSHEEWKEEEEETVDEAQEDKKKRGDPAAEREKRVVKMKDREKAAISIARDKEHMIRAKSSIRSAGLSTKNAADPKARARALKTIIKAKKTLANIGKKK